MNKIVLTQPSIRSDSLKDALKAVGWAPVEMPMSAIAEGSDLDWPEICLTAEKSRWVLFPSPAAIAVVMAALQRQGLRWPSGPGIGPYTWPVGPVIRATSYRYSTRVRPEPLAIRNADGGGGVTAERQPDIVKSEV